MKLRTTFTFLFFYSLLSFGQEAKPEEKHKKSHHEELLELRTEVAAKDQQIAELNKQIEELKSNKEKTGNVQGIVFKVQVGSFKNKDLSKYFENNKNFTGDTDADGTKKYTLGHFSDYWEADNFKKYLREMGVKDAWVVAYKNDKRLNIKDVLEGNVK